MTSWPGPPPTSTCSRTSTCAASPRWSSPGSPPRSRSAAVALVLPVGWPGARRLPARRRHGGASVLAWVAPTPDSAPGEGALRGELGRRRRRAAGRRSGPGGHGPGRGVPGAGAGVGRRARASRATAPLVVGRGGVGPRDRMHGGRRRRDSWSPSTQAITAHRLPGFMIAVLPLVALGAFEVVAPAADAVSRLADHPRRPIASWPWPTSPSRWRTRPIPPRRRPGSDVALEDAVLRYAADGPTVLDGLVPRACPTGVGSAAGRTERSRQEQHRQRPPPLLGARVGHRPSRWDRRSTT